MFDILERRYSLKRFKLVVNCDDDILCRMTKVMADESLTNTKYDVVSSYWTMHGKV